jgi:hypothetical protein
LRQPSLAGTKVNYFHVCAFFNSRDEEYDVLGPFFKEGIDWGEKTMHIVDPALMDDHIDRLRSKNIDTEHCLACGQLEVLSWDDVYLNGGEFDQERMLEAIDQAIVAGRAAGYERMRIMGNMGWTLKGRPGTEHVIEFESRVNEVLSRHRQLAVCVYDVARLSGAMMMDLLRSHPMTLVGSVIHENPYYTPPEALLAEKRDRGAEKGSGSNGAPRHQA